jgi:arabinogalactan endo-1,4-beta-galactosidase
MDKYVFKNGFASGADISWLPMMEATGFIFREKNGVEMLRDVINQYLLIQK